MIGVNFLWHMHQPDYRPVSGGPAILPWVRLHAVRGYLDLLSVLEQHPQMSCTVNFSGILLEQLLSYSPQQRDMFAELSLRSPTELNAEEVALVFDNFFSANELRLIRPNPRYAALLEKRDALRQHGMSSHVMVDHFSKQELGDLLVLFNLVWIGFTGRKRTDVQEVFAKGEQFSAADQAAVIAIQDELLAAVLPGYQRLATEGTIELSFTPHYHPILPLLHDLAGEGTQIEGDQLPHFAYPKDAQFQVQRGMEWYARAFGEAPKGAWPAEGSVSNKALTTLAEAGVRWAATDQQNLPQSEYGHLTPWRWRQGTHELLLFFRDTRLADNIGFEYSTWDPQEAAQHFVDNLLHLASNSPYPEPVVSVILDGENPWENYSDGGEAFLHALFGQITEHPELRPVTPGMLLDREFPSLAHVSSGSWIYGNFDIWTKDAEARQAWRLLAKAREELDPYAEGEVLEHLLAAEGSDWFWWYGDTFQSDQKPAFDALFRGHLVKAYELAGVDAPPEMYAPIGSPSHNINTSSDQGAMARGFEQPQTPQLDLSDWIV